MTYQEYRQKEHNRLIKAMEDKNFAEQAFYYEMWEHNYLFNLEGEFDVCKCFGKCEYSGIKSYADYLYEMGYSDRVVKSYEKAQKRYFDKMEKIKIGSWVYEKV